MFNCISSLLNSKSFDILLCTQVSSSSSTQLTACVDSIVKILWIDAQVDLLLRKHCNVVFIQQQKNNSYWLLSRSLRTYGRLTVDHPKSTLHVPTMTHVIASPCPLPWARGRLLNVNTILFFVRQKYRKITNYSLVKKL